MKKWLKTKVCSFAWRIKFLTGAGIRTPDFWAKLSRPKFEFLLRLDLSSSGFLELLDFNNAAFSTIYFHDFWSIHNVFLCDSGFYYWKSTEFCFISESSYLPFFLDLLIRSFGHFLFTFWYSVFGINWTIILHWK